MDGLFFCLLPPAAFGLGLLGMGGALESTGDIGTLAYASTLSLMLRFLLNVKMIRRRVAIIRVIRTAAGTTILRRSPVDPLITLAKR